MTTIDQAIRERAYHLWLADGQHDGRADSYWLTAQREILSSAMSNAAVDPAEVLCNVDRQAPDTKYPAKKAKAVIAPKKNKRRAA